mmetsp:Transcript_30080/g.55366  ORF Transcript_30080/g.55366 Transcript_30080/m.55366 type:complete len:115 (+) Transcript_30080:2049-2393(+)
MPTIPFTYWAVDTASLTSSLWSSSSSSSSLPSLPSNCVALFAVDSTSSLEAEEGSSSSSLYWYWVIVIFWGRLYLYLCCDTFARDGYELFAPSLHLFLDHTHPTLAYYDLVREM